MSHGHTHDDAAVHFNVQQPTYSAWENGSTARPHPRNWPALANYLGVSIAQLQALITGDETAADAAAGSVLDDLVARIDAIASEVEAIRREFRRETDSNTRALVELSTAVRFLEHRRGSQ